MLSGLYTSWLDFEDLVRRALRPCAVAVIGDVMLDRYVRGHVDRFSPEAPVSILDVESDDVVPGGSANVARKVVDLGAMARLVGLIGDDKAAAELSGLLVGSRGLTSALIEQPGRITTVKTRFVAQSQQLLRVDHEQRDVPEIAAHVRLIEAAHTAAAESDVVILEDYGKGVLTQEVIEAALAGARSRGVPVVVDPNGRDYRRYAGATLLTPNLREAEVATGQPIRTPADLEEAAARLVDQTGAVLAITRESQGISLFRRREGRLDHIHLPTRPVAVYDVTGAGDAVVACLAIALASGLDLVDSCTLANLAGRAVVRQFGVGTISLRHLLDEASEIAGGRPIKVVDLPRALDRVAEIRRAGGRIVFTNGCFDLLHYGHASLLQFARAQGDFLVLGLNTDDSIRRQKGLSRPIVSQDQRSTMLSLYYFVDLIVPFDDDTPLDLIAALRPDVLVKGGDYTPAQVVGHDLVESYGGRVIIYPRLEGYSTSNIVSKVLSHYISDNKILEHSFL